MEERNFALRLEMMVKNAELARAREKVGLNAKQAAAAIGIAYSSYLLFESMKSYPNPESMRKICEFYQDYGIEIDKDRVFPPELRNAKPKRCIKEKEIPVENLIYLSQLREIRELAYVQQPDEKVIEDETKEVIEKVIKSLGDKRAQKVLRMRFGIGDREHTLEEVGHYFDVTEERIRQIEAKALRKMRHPSKAKKLKEVYQP